MEVYDTANKLVEEIRQTKEYKDFQEAKEKVFKNPENEEKVKEFARLKKEIQIAEVTQNADGTNEEELKEKSSKVLKLFNLLVENEDIKDMFEKEIRVTTLMSDVTKIIGEVIQEVTY